MSMKFAAKQPQKKYFIFLKIFQKTIDKAFLL